MQIEVSWVYISFDRLGVLLPTLVYAYKQVTDKKSISVYLEEEDISWLNKIIATLKLYLKMATNTIEMQLESISVGKIDGKLFEPCTRREVVSNSLVKGLKSAFRGSLYVSLLYPLILSSGIVNFSEKEKVFLVERSDYR